jgi:hypothetical protein
MELGNETRFVTKLSATRFGDGEFNVNLRAKPKVNLRREVKVNYCPVLICRVSGFGATTTTV